MVKNGSASLNSENNSMRFDAYEVEDFLQEQSFLNYCIAANEEDVCRIELCEFLLRVFAAPARRNICDRPFEDLQQSQLDAFARNVASDGRVIILTTDLIDLVDVDDPLLGFLDLVAGRLEQTQQNVLDVFPDVARFRKTGGIHDAKRNAKYSSKCLGEKRLSRSRRTDQQNIRLLKLDVGTSLGEFESLVVLINRDREPFLRFVLPDHIFIEECLDLLRLRKGGPAGSGLLLLIVIDDLVADINALIADVNARTGDELLYIVLRFAAKRAA